MRVLTLANEKGGVGKSMIATQFAYYCADKLELKTLFIDLDHQANSTKAITSSEMCAVSKVTTSNILIDGKTIPEREPFLLVSADNRLTTLERQPDNHNKFANNLSRAIKDADDYYDICTISTQPKSGHQANHCASGIYTPVISTPTQSGSHRWYRKTL